MLFKFVGGLIIVGVSSFLGFYFSWEYGKRLRQLRELQVLFTAEDDLLRTDD